MYHSCLRYVGEKNYAVLVEEAIQKTVKSGIITPDLGGKSGTKEVGKQVLAFLKDLHPSN